MKIDVLDHGYVQLIETWGDGVDGDEDYEVGIIEAARQSTQASFRGWDEDAKLLRFLHKNNHSTPFEFAGMVIEVQAPIFVFRGLSFGLETDIVLSVKSILTAKLLKNSYPNRPDIGIPA